MNDENKIIEGVTEVKPSEKELINRRIRCLESKVDLLKRKTMEMESKISELREDFNYLAQSELF